MNMLLIPTQKTSYYVHKVGLEYSHYTCLIVLTLIDRISHAFPMSSFPGIFIVLLYAAIFSYAAR